MQNFAQFSLSYATMFKLSKHIVVQGEMFFMVISCLLSFNIYLTSALELPEPKIVIVGQTGAGLRKNKTKSRLDAITITN